MHSAHSASGFSGVPYSHMIDLRPIGYYTAIAIFMHALCELIGLNAIIRAAISILAPSLAALAVHLWWVAKIEQEELHYPISITPAEVLIFNLIAFGICFGVAACLLAFARWVTCPKGQVAG